MKADDLKSLIQDFTKQAQLNGIRPTSGSFYDICKDFNYELYAKDSKLLKTDKFAEVTEKLLFLSCVLLLDNTEYIQKKISIYDFALLYCGANDILLNEEFGETETKEVSLFGVDLESLGDDYYIIFNKLYELQPPSFHFYWMLKHFIGNGCIRYGNSFLVCENFYGMDKISEAIQSRISFTEELEDYLFKIDSDLDDFESFELD